MLKNTCLNITFTVVYFALCIAEIIIGAKTSTCNLSIWLIIGGTIGLFTFYIPFFFNKETTNNRIEGSGLLIVLLFATNILESCCLGTMKVIFYAWRISWIIVAIILLLSSCDVTVELKVITGFAIGVEGLVLLSVCLMKMELCKTDCVGGCVKTCDRIAVNA